MGLETRKTDYAIEPLTLIREQYKNSPLFGSLLELKGERGQELEDAIFSVRESHSNFGVAPTPPRDALNKKATMFGIVAPETKTKKTL